MEKLLILTFILNIFISCRSENKNNFYTPPTPAAKEKEKPTTKKEQAPEKPKKPSNEKVISKININNYFKVLAKEKRIPIQYHFQATHSVRNKIFHQFSAKDVEHKAEEYSYLLDFGNDFKSKKIRIEQTNESPIQEIILSNRSNLYIVLTKKDFPFTFNLNDKKIFLKLKFKDSFKYEYRVFTNIDDKISEYLIHKKITINDFLEASEMIQIKKNYDFLSNFISHSSLENFPKDKRILKFINASSLEESRITHDTLYIFDLKKDQLYKKDIKTFNLKLTHQNKDFLYKLPINTFMTKVDIHHFLQDRLTWKLKPRAYSGECYFQIYTHQREKNVMSSQKDLNIFVGNTSLQSSQVLFKAPSINKSVNITTDRSFMLKVPYGQDPKSISGKPKCKLYESVWKTHYKNDPINYELKVTIKSYFFPSTSPSFI